MKEVYILKSDLNEWIAKYFKKDLISIDDLLAVIEDFDYQVEHLQENNKEEQDWEVY